MRFNINIHRVPSRRRYTFAFFIFCWRRQQQLPKRPTQYFSQCQLFIYLFIFQNYFKTISLSALQTNEHIFIVIGNTSDVSALLRAFNKKHIYYFYINKRKSWKTFSSSGSKNKFNVYLELLHRRLTMKNLIGREHSINSQ